MSNYAFGADILQDVLFRAGELTALTGTTSDYLAAVKAYIWRCYNDLLEMAPWPWALKDPPAVINILAKVTGTATIVQGSASVTAGATITPSMAGRKFYIDSQAIPYRITAHTAGTSALTLDATYKEDNVTAGAFTIYQDEYTLASDCLRPWRPWFRNWPGREIELINPEEFNSRFRQRSRGGSSVVNMAYIRGNKVQIWPWPDDAKTIEYEYTVVPTALDWTGAGAGDTPIIPASDRHVLADWALVLLFMDKHEERALAASKLLQDKLALMQKVYFGLLKPRFFPRRGQSIGG